MNLKSRKTSLIILGITALACSRALFALFKDPEGPNLLIVVVVAAVIYAVSYAACLLPLARGKGKKFALALLSQILAIFALYYFLG